MPKILINESEHKIEVPILLTAVSGKIRIKNRSIVNEYGTPVAVRRDGFALSNYVEWQIGYDVVKKETEKLANPKMCTGCFFKRNFFVSHESLFPAPLHNPIKKNKVKKSNRHNSKFFGRQKSRQPD